jgi:non-heme chloroperoxidase
VRTPTLAIFAVTAPTEVIESRRGEPDRKIEDPVKVAEAQTRYTDRQEAIVKDFQSSMPAAHVVILRGASHYIFRSNEADVLHEMRAFFAGLK